MEPSGNQTWTHNPSLAQSSTADLPITMLDSLVTSTVYQSTNGTTPSSASKGSVMKSILLTVLLIVTLLTGLAPFTLFRAAVEATPAGRRRKYALLFTSLSCYGGGVFLATCLLDLLPDSIEQVTTGSATLHIDLHGFPLAETLVATGFFLILFMEQGVMWLREIGCIGVRGDEEEGHDNEGHTQSHEEENGIGERHDDTVGVDAEVEGSTEIGNHPFSQSATHQRTHSSTSEVCDRHRRHSDSSKLATMLPDKRGSTCNLTAEPSMPRPTTFLPSPPVSPTADLIENHHTHEHDDMAIPAPINHHDVEGGGHGHSHDVHFIPGSHSTIRAILLVVALSLHSIFEGLALGLEPSANRALQVFLALCIHKSLISFSLGMRLVQSSLRPLSIILCCVTFAVVSPFGGAVGILLIDIANPKDAYMISGCLTSIACGTFLYVTCFEILPHELNEIGNRMYKLISLILGFATIVLFILVLPN